MNSNRPSRDDIRLRGLLTLCEELEVSLDGIIDLYIGKDFFNSEIEKSSLIKNILKNSLNSEQEGFVNQRCALTYHKDRRNTLEYGRDLVIGWLAEDVVLKKLTNLGFKLDFNGNDKNREFLTEEQIGTQADYLLKFKDNIYVIELVISWDTYWKRTNRLDLRDSKYRNLTNKESNCLLIGIEPVSKLFFITSMAVAKKHFKWRQNPAWGNKGVFTLDDLDKVTKPITLFNRDFLSLFFKQ